MSAPIALPVADGTQKSSSSNKKKKTKPLVREREEIDSYIIFLICSPSSWAVESNSGPKKHKMVNNVVVKKDKPKGQSRKKSGSNKKSE